MQIPNKKQITRPAHTSEQSRKNYFIWLWSQTAVIIIIAAVLAVQGFLIYHDTMTLLNSSNKYMMEEVGIEATTELNRNGLGAAEEVIAKKLNPSTLPAKTRNIFSYDAIVYPNTNEQSVAPTSTVSSVDEPAAI